MKIFRFVLLTTVFLVLAASPAVAGNWYLGGGLESVSIEIDGDDSVDDGGGLTLSFGYQFAPTLALDFLWGASGHEDFLGGDVAYGRLLFGPKFILVASEQFKPYATIGIISNALDFDFFDTITGTGLYFGIGADYFIDSRNSIGLGIRGSSWTGEDSAFEYDMDTSIVSIVYNYHFIQ